ncbi:MAG: HAMP domain-containing protein [Phycisphaerae bacterium]|nr:HAMP domain-containing protein [Phycisphaerae bacterium]
MAKKFIKVSLATKFRLLFGAAVLAIIAAALVVPWYFTERLAEQNLQREVSVLTRLRLNEWIKQHPDNPKAWEESEVASLFLFGGDVKGRKGPSFITLTKEAEPARPIGSAGWNALKAFHRDPDQELAVIYGEDKAGRPAYHCFRAVRLEPTCMKSQCHGPAAEIRLQRQPGQLVGLIEVTMPGTAASGPLVLWTRVAFVIGGGFAALLACVVLAIITQKLVLRPVHRLRDVADKVAEGDLTVRSTIRTGDELQRLGDSFNEMLTAIADQHGKLRSANRALDLKLNELAEANVTLFQANKVKTEFLTNVSHELRTPLNSIIGFADLVTESNDDRINRYGQNISSAAKNLLNMINDLLDLAKIEAGRADARFDKVSLADTCQGLAALMKPLADKKHIEMNSQLSDDLPIIITDAGKLQQILYNLLSNAIKFTPAGGQVTLSAMRSTGRRNGKSVEEVSVSVADTGPGIAEADQKHIFEKFFRAEATLTKESPGTGLGLAIAKELTYLLGGRLTLKSSPGGGAAFTVTLPIDARKEPDAAASSKS